MRDDCISTFSYLNSEISLKWDNGFLKLEIGCSYEDDLKSLLVVSSVNYEMSFGNEHVSKSHLILPAGSAWNI